MNNSILILTVISLTIGIILAILILGLIYLRQRNQKVDSLVRMNNIIGRSGTVEIPFNNTNQGKVRINIKGTLIDYIAFTDEPREFNQGDSVFVVATKGKKIWVVSETNITK